MIAASPYVGTATLNKLLNRRDKVTPVVHDPTNKTGNPDLKAGIADIEDTKTITSIYNGKDDIIRAYNPGWSDTEIYEDTSRIYKALLGDVKKSGSNVFLLSTEQAFYPENRGGELSKFRFGYRYHTSPC